MGRRWHEINFRRLVPEPDAPESTQSTPSDESPAKPTSAVSQPPAAAADDLPAAFQQALTTYARLREDYAAGRVNPAQYRAALEELKLQDSEGRHWKLDGQSGSWLLWTGNAWVQARPLKTVGGD
jgi:hypothetical protein